MRDGAVTRYVLLWAMLLLLTLSVYLTANFLSSFSPLGVPTAKVLTTKENAPRGTLVLQAVTIDEVVYIGRSVQRPGIWPMRALSVSLADENNLAAGSAFNTNSDGLAQLSVPPGNYSLRIFDHRFNLSIPFQVMQDAVTQVSIRVEQSLRVPVFYEICGTRSSSPIDRGEKIYAAVPAGAHPPSVSSTVFAQAIYIRSPVPASQMGNEPVPASVTGVNLKNGLAWLNLELRGTQPIGNMHDLYIINYDTAYSVTIQRTNG